MPGLRQRFEPPVGRKTVKPPSEDQWVSRRLSNLEHTVTVWSEAPVETPKSSARAQINAICADFYADLWSGIRAHNASAEPAFGAPRTRRLQWSLSQPISAQAVDPAQIYVDKLFRTTTPAADNSAAVNAANPAA